MALRDAAATCQLFDRRALTYDNFVALRWQQPAPRHWAVTGFKGEPAYG